MATSVLGLTEFLLLLPDLELLLAVDFAVSFLVDLADSFFAEEDFSLADFGFGAVFLAVEVVLVVGFEARKSPLLLPKSCPAAKSGVKAKLINRNPNLKILVASLIIIIPQINWHHGLSENLNGCPDFFPER